MKKNIKDKNKVNDKSFYYESYDSLVRFISYYNQIKLILETKPKKVLEIGCGNKTVSDYLKRRDIKVVTADLNKILKPDVVCDVRELKFKNNMFDLVSCCEVLEHIPFSDFTKALKELRRVSKKYVLISLPYSHIGFISFVDFPIIGRRFFKFQFSLYKKHKFLGDHYWEIGRRGCSFKKIKNTFLKQGFNIIKTYNNPLNRYHYFFLLEVK